tara:strand:- start:915 stop:1124 length:210 start_codon:yes stop_codon:yes gene_type:complete
MASVLVTETLVEVFMAVLVELITPTVGDLTIRTMLLMLMVFTTHIPMEVTFPTTNIIHTIFTITEISIA